MRESDSTPPPTPPSPPPAASSPLAHTSQPSSTGQATLSPFTQPFYPGEASHGRAKAIQWLDDSSEDEAERSTPRTFKDVVVSGGRRETPQEPAVPPPPEAAHSRRPNRRPRSRAHCRAQEEAERRSQQQQQRRPKVRSIVVSGTLPYQPSREGRPGGDRSGHPTVRSSSARGTSRRGGSSCSASAAERLTAPKPIASNTPEHAGAGGEWMGRMREFRVHLTLHHHL